MPVFRPFKAFRPKPELAKEVAAKPYDVLSSEEAREEVKGHPWSFLHVGKPEVDLEPGVDLHDPKVYRKASENLQNMIRNGVLLEDKEPCFYLYGQTMNGRTQYGLVGCAAVQDYVADRIKKHEHTRKDKEEDRANHVRVTNSHSGPIFLTYRDQPELDAIVDRVRASTPENDFVAEDGIRHQVWVIRERSAQESIEKLFARQGDFYVADGHHRSAAAAIVGQERIKANPKHRGDEEYNTFLAVAFPASQLYIMDYNRVVRDLNGRTEDEFIQALKAKFSIEPAPGPVKPSRKGQIGMYLGKRWYVVQAGPELINHPDPVERLDVAILQKNVLSPLLGIKDPRTDKRIDFVGGIRGLGELEKRVNSGEMKVAFSMFATSIHELMAIADAGQIMPPKSTWFEPKLRDGLFVHFLG
ncbi:MAG: DUF1015 family protein [Oligoflexia bacterium]|nr:DUF1015 family protein [Oligoflexia bacterium]